MIILNNIIGTLQDITQGERGDEKGKEGERKGKNREKEWLIPGEATLG